MQLKDLARRLPDDIWAIFEPILPARVWSGIGRPPCGNRECLHALLYVLASGIGWEFLPWCFPSYKTVQRRLKHWLREDAFLRAWQELPRLQEFARFGGWLLQIVRNAAIDLRRRAKPTTAEFPDLAAAGPDPATASEQADTAARVQAALAGLDEVTRTAVVLRYYDGLSAKEIGELLELSSAAVDMRLSRARGLLRDRLAPLVQDEPLRPSALGESR